MFSRSALLVLLFAFNSAHGADKTTPAYEIEGVLVRENGMLTGMLINAGSLRQQFIPIDFSKSKWGNKNASKKIATPVNIAACVEFEPLPKKSNLIWMKVLSPSKQPIAFDRIPDDFKHPCSQR